MDESGVRVGCPAGEEVVVPNDVVDLYTASPENRKSITIFETIYADGYRKSIPPLVVCPGVKIMDNWVHDYLTGDEAITTSPTGYTNDKVVMDYLDHLIQHTKASAKKHWKLLLLDGHLTHEYPDFVVRAAEHHIALMVFPSHLTHALQPLDVGIFRPWKHYHNKAIQNAIRSLDYDYTITSFFRDLSSICQQTLKPHTIINSFKESGMWPVSAKAGIKKIRSYVKGTKSYKKKKGTPDSPKLPGNPISQTEEAMAEWIERDPRTWSSPSRTRHVETLKAARVQLNYAHLIDAEHQAVRTKFTEDQKRRTNSHKSLHKGGVISVAAARKKRQERDEKDKNAEIRKVERQISRHVSQAKKAIKDQGIKARKEEKNRKKLMQDLKSRGEDLPIGIDIPIRDPEKNPTDAELVAQQDSLRPHISLTEKLNELCPPTSSAARSVLGQEEERVEEENVDEEGRDEEGRDKEGRDEEGREEEGMDEERVPDDEELNVVTQVAEDDPGDMEGFEESSEAEDPDGIESIVDSSDAESHCSVDSIAQNADFVEFKEYE